MRSSKADLVDSVIIDEPLIDEGIAVCSRDGITNCSQTAAYVQSKPAARSTCKPPAERHAQAGGSTGSGASMYRSSLTSMSCACRIPRAVSAARSRFAVTLVLACRAPSEKRLDVSANPRRPEYRWERTSCACERTFIRVYIVLQPADHLDSIALCNGCIWRCKTCSRSRQSMYGDCVKTPLDSLVGSSLLPLTT